MILQLRSPQAHGVPLGSLALVVAALVFARPTPSFAQTITQANLVSSWALVDGEDKGSLLKLRADSTFLRQKGAVMSDGSRRDLTGRWNLVADTLILIPRGPATQVGAKRRLVTLKDRQLTLTKPEDKSTTVYERVDSLKP